MGLMSILRIVIGVVIGGSILAGLLAAAMRFPSVAMFVMFGTGGGVVLVVAYHGLRTGIIRAKRSRYERSASPFGFWFYILFYSLVGGVVLGYGIYCLFHPELGRK